MDMADPIAVIPPPFDPHVPIVINLDGEDCPNHRSDVNSFLLRQILHPSAREGNESNTCARDHWLSIPIFRQAHRSYTREYNVVASVRGRNPFYLVDYYDLDW